MSSPRLNPGPQDSKRLYQSLAHDQECPPSPLKTRTLGCRIITMTLYSSPKQSETFPICNDKYEPSVLRSVKKSQTEKYKHHVISKQRNELNKTKMNCSL